MRRAQDVLEHEQAALPGEREDVATLLRAASPRHPNARAIQFELIEAAQALGKHAEALALLKDYQASGAPGPLRDLAERLIPNVTSHLAMARALPR